MPDRFDGAITRPAESLDASRPPAPARPPRPVLVEIAAAILIVGGVTALLGLLGSAVGAPAAVPGASPIFGVLAALDVLTVLVGVLVRAGRAWILSINVVAVLLFVELTAVPSGSAIPLLYVALDAIVLFALMRHRDWFDWRPVPEEAAR